MKKETFIFYKDWANVLNDLPDTIQLEIYQAITAYAFGTTPKELSPLASVAFAFIKQTIDRDIEKYLSVSQARSQAGKKGGRPLKNKNLQEDKKPQPKESSRIKEEELAQGKENFSAKEEERAFFFWRQRPRSGEGKHRYRRLYTPYYRRDRSLLPRAGQWHLWGALLRVL